MKGAAPFSVRVRRKWPALLTLSAALCALSCTAVMAELVTPDDVLGIRRRIVPQDQGLGYAFGTFMFKPVLELRSIYDDNVDKSPTDKKSDLISNVRPAMELQSNWNRHALFFGAQGDFGYYNKNSDDDYKDYGLTASGQYDLAEETYLTAGVSTSRRHQGRGFTSELDTGDTQASYKSTSELLGFTRALSYIKLRIFGRNTDTKLSADDFSAFANDFVDRNSQALTTVLSYDYMKDNGFFLSNTLETTDYDLMNGVSHSSNGTDWRAGYNFNNGGTLSGTLFGGYILRDYDDATPKTKKPFFGGTANFNLSRLTTVSVTLDKNFNEITNDDAAGFVHTTRRVDFRQSLTSSLSASAFGGYDSNDYVGGTSGDRSTDLKYGGVQGDYQVTDGVGLRLAYDYRDRTSNQPDDSYKNNRVLFSLICNP